MKKGSLSIVMASLICLTIGAQSYLQQVNRYKTEGLSAYANGDYSTAIVKFDAALSVLKTQRINNSDKQYAEIDKELAKAQRTKELFSKAEMALDRMQEAPDLEKCEMVRRAYNEVLKLNPKDAVAQGRVRDCDAFENDTRNWELVKENGSLDAFRAFISEYPESFYIKIAQGAINRYDESVWERTKQIGTPDAYREYFSIFPDGVGERKNNLSGDFKLWDEANEEKSLDKYWAYKSLFPSGVYAEFVDDRIENLHELIDWESAVKKNTVASYNAYLSQYSNGSHRQEATTAINNIRDESAWKSAAKANTAESYRSYINSYSKGKHVGEAKSRVAEIEDDGDWAATRVRNTRTEYRAYLASHANGKYREDALANINKINAADEVAWQVFLSERTLDELEVYLRNYPDGNHSQEQTAWRRLFDANKQFINGNWSAAYNGFNSSKTILSYQEQKDMAYAGFMSSPTRDAGSNYIYNYQEDIERCNIIRDKMAYLIADEINRYNYKDKYKEAKRYAQTPEAQSYIKKKKNLQAGPALFFVWDNYIGCFPYGTYGSIIGFSIGREISHINLMAGIGYEYNNHVIPYEEESYEPLFATFSGERDELNRQLITSPLTLNLQFGGFYIGGGASFNYHVASKFSEYTGNGKNGYEELHDDLIVQPFYYDAIGRIGYKALGITVNYHLGDIYNVDYFYRSHYFVYDQFENVVTSPMSIRLNLTFRF